MAEPLQPNTGSLAPQPVAPAPPPTSAPPSSPAAPPQLIFGRWKRPHIPRPNRWVVVTGLTVTSLTSLYFYDRREARRITAAYCDQVRYLGDMPLGTKDFPRKLLVLSSRVPDDAESDRSLKFFRQYVKPILIAAGIDYQTQHGTSPGVLYRDISSTIRQHRLDAYTRSLHPTPPPPPQLVSASACDPDGGTIIIGRGTFKEYLRAIKDGWLVDLDVNGPSREEALRERLDDDGKFDETDDGPSGITGLEVVLDEQEREQEERRAKEGSQAPRSVFSSGIASPFVKPNSPSSPGATPPPKPTSIIPAPHQLPLQPPLLLMPYDQPLGMRFWPLNIFRFFNRRERARRAGEETLKIVFENTRPIIPPSSSSAFPSLDSEPPLDSPSEPSHSPLNPESSSSSSSKDPVSFEPFRSSSPDLDFDLVTESHIRKSYLKTPQTLLESRNVFYNSLPADLKVARELSRGERQPTKEESKYPPKTEVELRDQRFRKEKRWEGDREGWETVRPGSRPSWDGRMEGGLKVYTAEGEGDKFGR